MGDIKTAPPVTGHQNFVENQNNTPNFKKRNSLDYCYELQT